MTALRATRPRLFGAVLFVAVVVAFATHTDSDAQSTGYVCGGPTAPAVLTGRVFPSAQPGTTIQVLAFPQQRIGDVYLRSLAVAGGAPQAAPTGGIGSALNQLGSSMNDLQTLKENLPALYATMVAIKPAANGTFVCGGFSIGKWTLLAFEQAKVGSPPPLPTAHALPSTLYTADALSAYRRANPVPTGLQTTSPRSYYYSYAVVARRNLVSPPTPKPSGSGPPKAAPTPPPVVAATFLPIKYYPDGYFGAAFSVPTPAAAGHP